MEVKTQKSLVPDLVTYIVPISLFIVFQECINCLRIFPAIKFSTLICFKFCRLLYSKCAGKDNCSGEVHT